MAYRARHPISLQLAASGISLAAVLAAGLLASPEVHAQSSSAISRGFQSDQADINLGALVSVKKGADNQVSPASTDNASSLVGVVGDKPLIQIESGHVQLQVVTSGVTTTLVSDLNGNIQAGDRVVVSPVRGVGMRLSDGGYSVGVAQGDLSKANTSARDITAKDGSKKTIHVGSLPVLVNVMYYTGGSGSQPKTPLVQRVANAIAGKQTSLVRIAVAFTIFIMGFTVMAIILRSSAASTMTSIGRNPLAEAMIRKNFNFVVIIALGLLAVSLIAAYLSLVL
jgi:hypothetical protein